MASLLAAAPVTAAVPEDPSPAAPGSDVARPPSGAVPERTSAPAAATGPGNGAVGVRNTYELLPDHPGTIAVTTTLVDPGAASEVTLDVDDDVDVRRLRGFDPEGEDYVWDGVTENASLVYHWDVSDSRAFHDGGTWGIGHPDYPLFSARFGDDPLEVDVENAVDGAGFAAEETVILGAIEEYRRTVDGRELRLVVPPNGTPRLPPAAVVEMLANVTGSVNVGDRPPVTTLVATPTEYPAPVSGPSDDGRTLYVSDIARMDDWLEEYIAAGQNDAAVGEGMAWFPRATANYYGTQLAVRHGYADYGDFEGMLLQANEGRSVLSKPDTWEYGNSAEDKGAATIALLDRKIRAATGGNRTFADVVRRVRNADGGLTAGAFVRTVEDVGGEAAGEAAETYVTTAASPPTDWTPEGYEATFGVEPAEIDGVYVQARSVWTAGEESVESALDGNRPTVATGDRVHVEVVVRNAGGIPGNVAVRPGYDDENGSEEGAFGENWRQWVGPGERVTHTITDRFEEPGTYTVVVGFDSVTVEVRDPTGDVAVSPRFPEGGVVAGERTTIDVVVERASGGPVRTVLPVVVDGERVDEFVVALEGDEAVEKHVETTFLEAGRHTLTVGDTETTFRVDPASTATTTETATATPTRTTTGTTTPTATDPRTATPEEGTTGGGLPGFGAGTALLALLVGALLARRR